MPRNLRRWTMGDDSLVRTLPPEVAARRLGRTVSAVYQRRCLLGAAALTQALKDRDAQVRRAVADALKQVDPEAAKKAGVQ